MPHDKIKAAARARMAETGEPYAVARRAVIEAHKRAGRPGTAGAVGAGNDQSVSSETRTSPDR